MNCLSGRVGWMPYRSSRMGAPKAELSTASLTLSFHAERGRSSCRLEEESRSKVGHNGSCWEGVCMQCMGRQE